MCTARINKLIFMRRLYLVHMHILHLQVVEELDTPQKFTFFYYPQQFGSVACLYFVIKLKYLNYEVYFLFKIKFNNIQ